MSVYSLQSCESFSSSRAGFQTTSTWRAVTNFNMPAMSPTMTEGGIATWKIKEGQKFSTGDVLLEIVCARVRILCCTR